MTNGETKKGGSAKQITFLAVMVIVAAIAIGIYVVKAGKGGKGGNKIITNGARAPEFRLPAPDGRQVSLSDLRGKVVMVHFWATWCPPCVEELPTLAKLHQDLKGADFEMLAVSVDEGGADAVTAFMKKNGLDVPVLLDPDRSTAELYGTFKFPETYIVDREGIVRHKAIGPRDWTDPAALQFLKDMIAAR
jgi:peroxiredoxin